MDYSMIMIAINRLLKETHAAILANDINKAKQLAAEMAFQAKLLKEYCDQAK